MAVVETWVQQLNILQKEYELFLVDDASTDRTPTFGDDLVSRHPHIRLFRHESRRGFGACLRTGLDAAQHPLLCYTVCDRQYQPADLKRLLAWIDKVDMVVGCRMVRSRPMPFRWQDWWKRFLIRRLMGVHMRDLDCLFLLARRHIFAQIPIQSNSQFAHVEILAKANFLGCFMTEAPVSFQPLSRITPNPWATDKRQNWREVRHFFFHPDFGPLAIDVRDQRSEVRDQKSETPNTGV